MSAPAPALRMEGAGVWRARPDGTRAQLLAGVDWTVRPGERWAVIGANGAGKSTLLTLAAAHGFPSEGRVHVLGEEIGHVDMRALRERIGRVDAADATAFRTRLSARDVVLTGATGSIHLREDRVLAEHRDRADELLALLGCSRFAHRRLAHLSRGERQRVLLARALMARPALLLLDEPTEGLDLPGRETYLEGLETLAAARPELAMVQVSHHLEDLPRGVDHAMLLRAGRVVARGPASEVLTEDDLSRCFGVPVRLARLDGRLLAVVAAAPRADAAGDGRPVGPPLEWGDGDAIDR